ncbi:ubiquitin C [Coprinopsis cinerea AmutBmut pab1-1]|nr:ubiquitin C [Coprinopsis cinerea AmutBmut pab1-1]
MRMTTWYLSGRGERPQSSPDLFYILPRPSRRSSLVRTPMADQKQGLVHSPKVRRQGLSRRSVYQGILLFVKLPSGDTTSLNVSKDITFSELKRLLQEELRCSSDPLLFFHRDQQLRTNSRTLQDYGIESGSMLRIGVVLSNGEDPATYTPTFQIQVKTLRGTTIPIGVDENMDVEDLELILWTKGEPSPGRQRLIFKGKQFVEGRTLGYYNVQPGSVLHLVYSLRGGGDARVRTEYPGAYLLVTHPWSGEMQLSYIQGLKVERGDSIICEELVCPGWLRCTNKDGSEGLVPITHVALLRVFKQSLYDELKATSAENIALPALSSPPTAKSADEPSNSPQENVNKTPFHLLSFCCPSLGLSNANNSVEILPEIQYLTPWDEKLATELDTESLLKVSEQSSPTLRPFPYPDPDPPVLLKHEIGAGSSGSEGGSNSMVVAFELSCSRLKSPSDNPSVHVLVKCIAPSPDRIFSIAFTLHIERNEIIDVSPQEVLGNETHTELSSTDRQKGGLDVGISVEGFRLGGNYEREKGVEKVATQVTQMSIKGVRIGREEARWALAEDPSDAGRKGLPLETELSIKVRFKPKSVRCRYTVVGVKGDREKVEFENSCEVNL